MDAWVKGFAAWDVCNQICLNAFVTSPLAVHDKKADDVPFIVALALVQGAADDDRNFVKKAVNWALRNMGKRNKTLRPLAIAAALRIQ